MTLAFLAVAMTFYGSFVRPAQQQHKAALPEPAGDPRVPRDMSRPYPRGDSAATEETLRTCPVCGMTDLDQMIPDDLAEIFSWPVHASCKEWLGEWRPEPPAPPPYKPDKSLIGYIEKGQKPPQQRRKARYPVIDISTVLTVDGFHEGGYQVALHTVPYEDCADLPGSPLVSIQPRYAAATLLHPEPVMYGWSVHIRGTTPEEAHMTLAALEDKARAGLPLATTPARSRFA